MYVKVSIALILTFCVIYENKVTCYMKYSRSLSKIPLKGSRFDSTVNVSPMESRMIFGREIFIKRDDLLTFPVDIGVRGNKIRKLQSLYDLGERFPRSVYSYGGNQSNAMRALALLCKEKNANFTYFTRTISNHLKENPQGNFAEALDAGMKVRQSFIDGRVCSLEWFLVDCGIKKRRFAKFKQYNFVKRYCGKSFSRILEDRE